MRTTPAAINARLLIRCRIIRGLISVIDPLYYMHYLHWNGKEEIKKQGGTEDDKTTWTGKRIRNDGTVVQSEQSGGVGKYLHAAKDTSNSKVAAEDDPVEAEPVRKKMKTGGFGNFDNW